MLAARKVSHARAVLPGQRARPIVTSRVVCRAHEDNDSMQQTVAFPLAAMVAAAMLGGAFCPEEALAARSSGRTGGASGFSTRKNYSRPAASAPSSVRSTTVVVAPPVYSPPVFSPFGFGGGGFQPFGYGYGGGISIGMPVPIFGGLFQFLFLALIVSVVFNVIKGIASSASSNSKGKDKDDDQWGNL